MADTKLEIVETDEAGGVVATYVSSVSDQKSFNRIDVILPEAIKSPWQRILDIFLPAGYPHSVTKDYLEYQIYDSLQAFSSSIAGLLSSRAVLSSVGVGDSTASPTAALLLSVLQESAGRIATILFAYRLGTSLEPECKMYRLLADILNDLAFVLDCLSPVFPKPIRVVILSFSSVLRALCGVAAGSAKASLSAHFARWGNLGELNAKDSSQETVISLMGMLAGSLIVSWVTSPIATWTTLILLLSIHLETNRRAVRAVSMRTLNRQRATLVYHHLRVGRVPTPEDVSAQESIFERDGILRGPQGQVWGYCSVGASISDLLRVMKTSQKTSTGSLLVSRDSFANVISPYEGYKFIVWRRQGDQQPRIDIVIKKDAVATDVLCAWWASLAMAETSLEETAMSDSQIAMKSSAAAQRMLRDFSSKLRDAGWDLGIGALETTSSARVTIS